MKLTASQKTLIGLIENSNHGVYRADSRRLSTVRSLEALGLIKVVADNLNPIYGPNGGKTYLPVEYVCTLVGA
jgi:hypothetical protein